MEVAVGCARLRPRHDLRVEFAGALGSKYDASCAGSLLLFVAYYATNEFLTRVTARRRCSSQQSGCGSRHRHQVDFPMAHSEER